MTLILPNITKHDFKDQRMSSAATCKTVLLLCSQIFNEPEKALLSKMGGVIFYLL